jgi:hypothetical protein
MATQSVIHSVEQSASSVLIFPIHSDPKSEITRSKLGIPSLGRVLNFVVKPKSQKEPSEDWKEEVCDLEMYDLMNFIDRVRAVSLRIWTIPSTQISDYQNILETIERELLAAVQPHADLLPLDDDAGASWGILTRLVRSISRVLPTDENNEMVLRFYNMLESKRTELDPTFKREIAQEKIRLAMNSNESESREASEEIREMLIAGALVESGPLLAFLRRLKCKSSDGTERIVFTVHFRDRSAKKNIR